MIRATFWGEILPAIWHWSLDKGFPGVLSDMTVPHKHRDVKIEQSPEINIILHTEA